MPSLFNVRFGPICFLSAVAALAAAAPAMAGTLGVDHGAGVIAYQATAGEANDFSVWHYGNGDLRIQDQGVSSVPLTEAGGSTCALAAPITYRCPGSGLSVVRASLGDGADTFNDANVSLATTVWAGAGAKSILTGGGNDTVNARNGSADSIACGGGADSVVADANDTIDSSCERVSFVDAGASTPPPSGGDSGSPTATGSTSGGGAGTTGDPGAGPSSDNVFTQPLGTTVAAATVPVVAGRALAGLSCGAQAAGGCRGEVALIVLSTRRVARGHASIVAARGHFVAQQRKRRLGRATFKLAPGATARVPIVLRGHFANVIRRRHQRALLRITERDAAGKALDVQTRPVNLKLTNKWSRKRGRR